MGLTSLLVCADAGAVQVLSRSLLELGVELETCGDVEQAKRRISQKNFDAVVVDYVQPGATLVIGDAKAQGCVVIAIAGTQMQASELLSRGADFVLYKPISRERVSHSLRAVKGLLRSERRVQSRIPVHASASLSYATIENASATLLDLNETGLGMRSSEEFPPGCRIYFQFSVPGNNQVVRLAGEVMWQDSSHRVGIRFSQVPQASKRVLQTWVQSNLSSGVGLPDRASEPAKETTRMGLSAGLGLLAVSSADRRKPDRHGCNIGAQIYRSDNTVPVRCTLSDISSGGCYIETTEPFEPGTTLEIVVHTHELKLCIAGRVRTTNRGFGMGVEFCLRNEEQKAQVQQLIATSKQDPKLIG